MNEDILIIVLIVLFILLLIAYIYSLFQNSIEGFDLGDVNQVVNKIDNVVNIADQIPSKLNNIDDRIVNRVTVPLNSAFNSLQQNITNSLNDTKTSIENNVTKKIDNLTTTLEQKVTGTLNTAKTQIEDNMLNQLEDLTDTLENKLQEGIDNAKNQIEENVLGKIDNLGNEIKKNTIDLITNKLTSIFKQLGSLFDNGLIRPFMALFEGLGNIFIQLFNILKMIGNKIASLPSCSIVYGIQTSIDIAYAMYTSIVPSALVSVFNTLYEYTFGILFNFIGYITGYNEAVKQCYGFNVNDELDKMNSNAKDIQKAFVQSWGLDFSKIKI